MYFATQGAWPSALTDITGNTTFFPDGEPNCPFGTAYVYSLTTYRVADHSH
jgi:hypothetical protein